MVCRCRDEIDVKSGKLRLWCLSYLRLALLVTRILVPFECALSSLCVFYDGLGIAQFFKLCFAQSMEGIVNGVTLDVFQLWYKVSDVVAVWVAFFALAERVEDSEVRLWVGAGAGAPLPASVVTGKVLIDKVEREMAFAVAPIVEEMFGEKHGRDHASTVVDVALLDALTLGGVDDRIASSTLFPSV